MTKNVHIGDVAIPLADFAVAGTAWLGIKKAGKTYGAKGVAEQLMEHGIPLIVFDAIGVWRFLKVPGDDAGAKGFKIVVAGGEQPDIPLSAHNASEIVRAAMRSNVSLVIDLYDPKLSKADWRRIVQTCFHTLLYENKKYGSRYIILEEAAEYVPQKVYDGETFAAVEKLARMGGNAGLGIALINQRSQEINKSVLDLCDNLVLMRQRGNAAIDAVQKWMDKVSPDIADEITASLPNMSGGECWVWAENSDTPVKTKTHRLKSFHPDRTKGNVTLKTSRQVDAAEFVSQLLAELPKVVEEKKANDPAELKKQLAELKRELAKKTAEIPRQARNDKPAPPPKRVEVPVLKDGQIGRLEKFHAKMSDDLTKLQEFWKDIGEGLRLVATANKPSAIKAPPAAMKVATPHRPVIGSWLTPKPKPARVSAREETGAGGAFTNGELDGAQQKILNTIATLKARGLAPNREMVARWMGIHPNGGRYLTNLAVLRSNGLVEERGCELTGHGEQEAVAQDTGLEAARSVLDGSQQDILDKLKDGDVFDRTTLAEALGLHPNGGRYLTNLARLRTMGVIPERGTIKLTEAALQ